MHSKSSDGEIDVTSKVMGYSLRLEFDEVADDGTLPGRIYLCYPDDEKSYVAGTFRAVIE